MVAVVTALRKPSVPTIPETPPAAASWAIHCCRVRSVLVAVLPPVAVAGRLLAVVVAWVCKIWFRMNVDADFVSHFPFNATFSNLMFNFWLIWLLSRNSLQFSDQFVSEIDLELNGGRAQILHVSVSP